MRLSSRRGDADLFYFSIEKVLKFLACILLASTQKLLSKFYLLAWELFMDMDFNRAEEIED